MEARTLGFRGARAPCAGVSSRPRMSTSHDDTTQTTPKRPSAGLQLRVVTTSGPQMLALPARGAVTIGRSDEADLRIDDR